MLPCEEIDTEKKFNKEVLYVVWKEYFHGICHSTLSDVGYSHNTVSTRPSSHTVTAVIQISTKQSIYSIFF